MINIYIYNILFIFNVLFVNLNLFSWLSQTIVTLHRTFSGIQHSFIDREIDRAIDY